MNDGRIDRGERPVRILISACLLGEKVRYDGGHQRDAFLADTLGKLVEYVPVCPEVECGLPVPREAMRLVGDPDAPRLVGSASGQDRTDRMSRWTARKLEELAPLDLYGYICKKSSPSSGMERVKVYAPSGAAARTGSGLFTKAFMERFPLVPVEEDGRMRDPVLREMFFERVFTMRRFRDLVASGGTRGGLVEFHTDHKLLLLSHGRSRYDEMGRLVARAKGLPTRELYGRYLELLVASLGQKATPGKTADVLLHMAGHLKRVLDGEEKREMLDLIDRYRKRLVPLVVPLTLLKHHARKHRIPYLERQVLLDPHPVERMLRNHA